MKKCHNNFDIEKKDRKNVASYRLFTLLVYLYKLFITVLKNRVSSILEANQPPKQATCKRGYSTIDHLHTVNRLLEKANAYEISLYTAFLGYEKAFASIEHRTVFQALG